MPIVANYEHYTYDRCGKDAYIQASDNAQKSKWSDIKRTDANNVTSERVLCESCAKEYRAMATRQDGEFDTFMAGVTPSEVN